MEAVAPYAHRLLHPVGTDISTTQPNSLGDNGASTIVVAAEHVIGTGGGGRIVVQGRPEQGTDDPVSRTALRLSERLS